LGLLIGTLQNEAAYRERLIRLCAEVFQKVDNARQGRINFLDEVHQGEREIADMHLALSAILTCSIVKGLFVNCASLISSLASRPAVDPKEFLQRFPALDHY